MVPKASYEPLSLLIFICAKDHATAVKDELREAFIGLDKKANTQLLKAIATSIENITTKQNAPPQRVEEAPTSEDMPKGQRVG